MQNQEHILEKKNTSNKVTHEQEQVTLTSKNHRQQYEQAKIIP